MLSVLGFLIILGPLVIVHEFGHYFFARLFGVKAEIFSVGFGPRIWSRQRGETEWRLSAIPLGGYVKLLGEDRDSPLPPEEERRALHKQKPWKRLFIFAGGPLFNFFFAILVFMAMLMIGEPHVASVVGRVVNGSAADKAGFRSGDRITAVGGKPVRRYDEVLHAVGESPGKSLEFDVEHPGQSGSVRLTAVPTAQKGFSVYGEATDVGEIDGMLPHSRATAIGIASPSAPAAKAGLLTGDRVVSIGDVAVASWEELTLAYARIPAGTDVKLMVVRGGNPAKTVSDPSLGGERLEKSLRKPAVSRDLAADWGLHSSELFVEKTVAGSPAEAGGVKGGDRLISVGGVEVHSFFELRDAVQRAGEGQGKVVLAWERAGQKMTKDFTPNATQVRDPALKKTTQFTVGVVPMLSVNEPATLIDRVLNPFTLVYEATQRMVVFSWRNFVAVRKMITGDVSVGTLGGPIMIGKIAGESLSRGLIAFLSTMAILSVGLGVLNILPIPILDGGHILLLGIEAIRGRPLTLKQMEVIQGVGLSLILLLMVVVIRNDITRLPFFE